MLNVCEIYKESVPAKFARLHFKNKDTDLSFT